ncbi:MAG: DUF2802 domain-containing protein [Rhodocyclaceae bacterium]|nr:DUF2802 domain-containing protein [Rhodocyclaceae bacterium]
MAAFAVVYLVVMLLKLAQIGRRHPAGREPAFPLEPVSGPEIGSESADAVPVLRGAPADAVPPAPTFANQPPAPAFEWTEVKDLFGATSATGADAPPQTGFGEHLAEHLARAEMEMEVQRMRAEMERMRAEMDELRLARRVSPQYAEAMELAQRGFPAQAVADRLGISLAEAELVHALSRGDKNFAEGEDHGRDEYVPNDGPDEFDNRRFG